MNSEFQRRYLAKVFQIAEVVTNEDNDTADLREALNNTDDLHKEIEKALDKVSKEEKTKTGGLV